MSQFPLFGDAGLLPYPAQPKLELRHVAKRFEGRTVLEDVSLDVAVGRSLVIIGGSGAGKSVTLKIAIGLMQPDSGQVLVDGVPVGRADAAGKTQAEHMAKFGLLFQGGALFDSLNVWQNVSFRLINADKVSRREARERACEALRQVGLDPPAVAKLYPNEISGGMQKRVGLARAIVAHPEIIFFDEPTTGLDPINSDVINNLIVEQVRRLGCTTVSITHDMASARKIADEIAMLHRGRIVWRGPARRHRPHRQPLRRTVRPWPGRRPHHRRPLSVASVRGGEGRCGGRSGDGMVKECAHARRQAGRRRDEIHKGAEQDPDQQHNQHDGDGVAHRPLGRRAHHDRQAPEQQEQTVEPDQPDEAQHGDELEDPRQPRRGGGVDGHPHGASPVAHAAEGGRQPSITKPKM